MTVARRTPCTDCPSGSNGRYDVLRDGVPMPVCQRCAFRARRNGESVLVYGRYLMSELGARLSETVRTAARFSALLLIFAAPLLAQTSAPVRYGTLATCTYVGELWMDTSSTPTLKKCTGLGSPGVWVAVEGSEGGGATNWGQIGGTLSNQSDLNTALSGKAASVHTHAISDVTSLQSALDGKAATGHTHSGLAPTGGTTGQVLKKSSNLNFDYAWSTDESGAGGAAWGDLTGTLSDQTDLQSALDGKANTSHTHVEADITDFAHTHAAGDLPTASTTASGIVELATSAETTSGLAVQASDTRLSDARTPTTHSHVDADIPNTITIDLATAASALNANPTDCAPNQFATTIAANGNLTCAAIADADVPNNITISLAAAATALAANPTDCTSGQFANAIDASGNLTCAAPSGGADPWTCARLASDFTTTSATAVDVTGLNFTPVANTTYKFEANLLLRTATATVNPRAGFAWSTGLSDGVVSIYQSQTATTELNAQGNSGAAVLVAVGGLPNTTASWPAHLIGMAVAGSSPSGTTRVQIASETAGATVTVKAGSTFCRRSIS
jgi:hypothetical protein